MFALGALWRWWTESWRSPRRARVVYGAMAFAFGALAVIGGLRGEALVAAVAGALALLTLALAALAPRLSRWSGPPEDVR